MSVRYDVDILRGGLGEYDESTHPTKWLHYCSCKYWMKGGYCAHAGAAAHCAGYLDLRKMVRPISDVLSGRLSGRPKNTVGRRFKQPVNTARKLRVAEVRITIIVRISYN